MIEISEKDWELINSMKKDVLEKTCGNIINKIRLIIDDKLDGTYKKYLDLCLLMKCEDNNLKLMFDDLKRCTAPYILAVWRKSSLISDDDLMKFSTEFQETVFRLKEEWQ